MLIIAKIILFVLCVCMFCVKRKYKIILFIVPLLLFRCVNLFPGTFFFSIADHCICTSFVLSELRFLRFSWKQLGTTHITMALLLIMASDIVTTVNSNNNIIEGIVLLLEDLLFKYLVILYAFHCYDEDIWKVKVPKVIFYCLIIMTLIGVINFCTQSNFYINSICAVDAPNNLDLMDGRFRVTATFIDPFHYGFACVICFLLLLFSYVNDMCSRKISLVGCAMAAFGLITNGNRTSIIVVVISVFIYFLRVMTVKSLIKKSIPIILVSVFFIMNLSALRMKIAESISIFQIDSKVPGSSLSMRLTQFELAKDYMDNNFLWGHGIDFVNRHFFGKNAVINADMDAFGFESEIFHLMINKGIIGLLAYLLFFLFLFAFFFLNRRINHADVIGMAITFSFFFFFNSNR